MAFGFLRQRAIRAGLTGLSSAAVIAGLAVAGTGHGYPARETHQLSGAAWLASSQVGQVTLMDGSSAEVAAQVQVAPPGHALDVVQQGATGYAIDRTAGTLRRIDGATFTLSSAQAPIPGARAGLTAFADSRAVYAVDTQRGLLVTADPHTLSALEPPISLAAQLATGAATLDDAGRLWLIDNSTGDLTRVAGGQRTTVRGVAEPGRTLLTLVNGNPVVVDTTAHKAVLVAPDTGKPLGSLDLDLRPNDTIAVSGSPHAQRLYIVASRGVLDICDLASASCNTVVPLDTANNELGSAIEAGERLFVPDYTTGQVWIIDLAHSAVVATPQVLTPAGRFQLLTRDGIVFFNDPNTERAGVIQLDGNVTRIAKYDPGNPRKGLTGSPSSTNAGTNPGQPAPSSPNPPTGAAPPAGAPNPPTVGNQPPPPVPVDGGGSGPPTSTGTGPPPNPVPHLQIVLSTTSPAINQDVNLQVNADTGTPTAAHWDFGDSQQGDGVTVTHHWTKVQTYQVSVTATMSDGQQATTAVSIQVTPPPNTTVPNVVGQTEAAAKTAISGAGLVTAVNTLASNTVAAGLVISQSPNGGASAASGSTVTITVSSGKPPVFDLQAKAGSATWTSSSGAQLPFPDNDTDANGFALIRTGPYTIDNGNSGNCELEGSTAAPYLETHPQWVTNGWIKGTYTLPTPVIAGDHFRASVGLIKCANLSQIGDVNFSVSVLAPGGTWVQVTQLHATGADGVMHSIDVDLSGQVGATEVRLEVEGLDDQAMQCWAAWLNPQIGG